ncbi:hypothetical protein DXC23_08230 [Eubacterium sp. OM08-24]|uniref:hypothetical protein n=1 Tax=Eubacterium sp. OM08-24 TaxID=2292352 RepID=UPI000E450441|nr:hypothetical protein [Eubacterium sp. OM08-24]RGM19262.1 hypothetical protein DXC23_08230 [Eubacterium sp. OM08-24]
MTGELIFYAARKTSLCERSLRKSFSELDMIAGESNFAANCKALGELVVSSLQTNDIVFVTGGLDIGGDTDSPSVFARALADNPPKEMKRLKNSSGSDGYVFATESQAIILLPDDPQQIESIMNGALRGFLKRYRENKMIA